MIKTDYDFIINLMTKNIGIHRFIDVDGVPDWQEIMNQLLSKYGKFKQDTPSAIFIGNQLININENCDVNDDLRIKKTGILTQYYRYLIASSLVEHLCEIPKGIEEPVLNTFRFGEKASDISDLLHKLKSDLLEFKYSYEIGEQYNPKIKFLGLDSLMNNFNMYSGIRWFCNLYFNAIDINKDAATVLNDYISSRTGGSTCFNIIFDGSKGYPSNIDCSGILIENVHDYQLLKIQQKMLRK